MINTSQGNNKITANHAQQTGNQNNTKNINYKHVGNNEKVSSVTL